MEHSGKGMSVYLDQIIVVNRSAGLLAVRCANGPGAPSSKQNADDISAA